MKRRDFIKVSTIGAATLVLPTASPYLYNFSRNDIVERIKNTYISDCHLCSINQNIVYSLKEEYIISNRENTIRRFVDVVESYNRQPIFYWRRGTPENPGAIVCQI